MSDEPWKFFGNIASNIYHLYFCTSYFFHSRCCCYHVSHLSSFAICTAHMVGIYIISMLLKSLFCCHRINSVHVCFPGFPDTIGVIDCTHVRTQRPRQHENAFVNRHGYHSLNVQVWWLWLLKQCSIHDFCENDFQLPVWWFTKGSLLGGPPHEWPMNLNAEQIYTFCIMCSCQIFQMLLLNSSVCMCLHMSGLGWIWWVRARKM